MPFKGYTPDPPAPANPMLGGQANTPQAWAAANQKQQGGAPAAPAPVPGNVGSIEAQLQADPTVASQIAQYLMGGSGIGMAQGGLTFSTAEQSLGTAVPGMAVQGQNAISTSGYQLASDLLGYQGTQLQGQGLAEQAGTAAAQQGIETGQYGLQAQQFPEQQAEAALAYKNKQQNLQGGLAASGTLNTQGSKEQQGTAAQEYAWQQADIYRNQQLAQLSQQSEQVGYGGQQEQIANAQAQLALSAQQQGLDVQQVVPQLGFALQQLGISAQPQQLLATAMNAQGGQAQAAQAVLSQAGVATGLGATLGQ